MGIPDHLPCLLRNMHASQEATVRIGHSIMDWFKNGKGPCLFNFYAECIMQNTRLDKAQAGIKIARRNISNLRHADNTTLLTEKKRN